MGCVLRSWEIFGDFMQRVSRVEEMGVCEYFNLSSGPLIYTDYFKLGRFKCEVWSTRLGLAHLSLR